MTAKILRFKKKQFDYNKSMIEMGELLVYEQVLASERIKLLLWVIVLMGLGTTTLLYINNVLGICGAISTGVVVLWTNFSEKRKEIVVRAKIKALKQEIIEHV